jgi:2-oxoisovalerate dehydrogenase E1 component
VKIPRQRSAQIQTTLIHGKDNNLPGESGLFSRDEWGKPVIAADPKLAYAFCLLIRKTEQLLLQLFSQGLLSGTTHTCLGQELCQLSVVRALTDPEDIVLSNHRNHGHFLAYSGAFAGLLGEIMGREVGVCGGVGGSQHIAYRHFHSNGVQGGMTAIGVGHALAMKRRKQRGVTAVIVGDGTLGEGLLYESLNLASIWKVPVLFVVENNGIAQTTSTAQTTGGSIDSRGAAFGLKTWHLDDSAPGFLSEVEDVVGQVRSSGQPGFLVIDTKRLGPHSKGDDLRPESVMEEIRLRDPVANLGKQLPIAEREAIETLAEAFVEAAHQVALNSPEARSAKVARHIFKAKPQSATAVKSASKQAVNVRSSLNAALRQLLTESPEVILLGEDLHDPYGGAFKVTTGLSTDFPDRTISTPISEAGVTGAGIGLALAGFRPIVEIMFADFVTLAMDQIFNHAVKFPGMFPDAQVPLVIRTPSGGRRGYGPTHSQSPETLMSAVPGLTVVFGSNRHDVGELLKNAVLEWPYPTMFFEHKLLYGQMVERGDYRVLGPDAEDVAVEIFPTLVRGPENPDVSLVCYGGAVALAEAAASRLAEEEITSEIVIPSLLSPFPRNSLGGLLSSREHVVVFEEGQGHFGFGAELGAVLSEAGYRGRFQRVGPPQIPIPAARSLEADVLPGDVELFDSIARSILAGILRQS